MFKNSISKFITSILLSICFFVVFHQLLTLSPLILTLVQIILPPLEHFIVDYLFVEIKTNVEKE